MVIEDDDIDTTFLEFGDFAGRSGAAINCDQQMRMMLLEAAFHAFVAQAVAFLHSQRQKKVRGCSISAEHLRQQGERCHPIDVIISKQHDAFARIQRSQDPSDCCAHLRQQKWIAQRAKARSQIILNFARAPKLFPGKKTRDAF